SVFVPVLVALLMNFCSGTEKKEVLKPNILYIMADDHAYQAMSCYGYGLNETPNIDRIAAEGVMFNQSFVTNSICAPSRAVLLTGKYSHINGHRDNSSTFDGGQQTFPKLLQQSGYQTAMIGKWHLRSEPTGFDYWNILPGQGAYYNPDFTENGVKKKYEGYTTNIVTDLALEWLKNQRDDTKPFCLLLHHKAPHRNWMPDTSKLHLYDDRTFDIPANFHDDYSTMGTAAKEQDMMIGKTMMWGHDMKFRFDLEGDSTERFYWRQLDRMTPDQRAAWDAAYEPENQELINNPLEGKELAEWKFQRYIKDYLRTISSVDDNVGRVLDFLDEYGLAENTIVIYTSDQGFYLGEHGWFDKRFIYEQSLRMPLVIRYPAGIEKGQVLDEMVMNLDFAPTILDYAGVSVPEDIQGRSFRKTLEGKTPEDWREAVYYHYYEYPAVHSVKRHYGIRTDRYKLIHFYYDIDEWELYDLENDPDEMNNIINDPENASLIDELKIKLVELQEQYGDSEELARSFIPEK
ncbi:MAG: sulfatase, partial [Bacteroidales bacterium]